MEAKLFKIRSGVWKFPIFISGLLYCMLTVASINAISIYGIIACPVLAVIHFWAFKILRQSSRLLIQSPAWAGSINVLSIIFYLVFFIVGFGVISNLVMLLYIIGASIIYGFLVAISFGLVLLIEGFKYSKFINVPKAFFGWEADIINYWIPNTHDRIPLIALTILVVLLFIPTMISIMLVLLRKRIQPVSTQN
jgi:hypothetical protein